MMKMVKKLVSLCAVFALSLSLCAIGANAVDTDRMQLAWNFNDVVSEIKLTQHEQTAMPDGSFSGWIYRNAPTSEGGYAAVNGVALDASQPENRAAQITVANGSGTNYFTLGRPLDRVATGSVVISCKIGISDSAPDFTKLQIVPTTTNDPVDAWYGRGREAVVIRKNGAVFINDETVPGFTAKANQLYDFLIVYNGEKQILKGFLLDETGRTVYSGSNRWQWFATWLDGNPMPATNLAAVTFLTQQDVTKEKPTVAYYDDLKAEEPEQFLETSHSEQIAANGEITVEYNTVLDADSLSAITASVTTQSGETIMLTPSVSAKRLTLKPSSALVANASYTVNVSGVKSVFGDAAAASEWELATGESEPIWNFDFDDVTGEKVYYSDHNYVAIESADQLNGWLTRNAPASGQGSFMLKGKAMDSADPSNKVLQMDVINTTNDTNYSNISKGFDRMFSNEKLEISVKIGMSGKEIGVTYLQMVSGATAPVWAEGATQAIMIDRAEKTLELLGEKAPDVTLRFDKLYDFKLFYDGENQVLKGFVYDGEELLFASSENRWSYYYKAKYPNFAGITLIQNMKTTGADTPVTSYWDDLIVTEPSAFALVSHSEKIDPKGEIALEYSAYLDADSIGSADISVTSQDGETISVTPRASGKKLFLEPAATLADNAIYTVSVSGVKNMFGDTAPAVTKSFLTSWNVRIDIVLNGSADNKTLADGNNTVTAAVTSNDGTEKPVTLIAALYDRDTNALLAASADKGVAAEDGTALNLSASCDLSAFASRNCEMKVLVWNGFDSMAPYGEPTVFQ